MTCYSVVKTQIMLVLKIMEEEESKFVKIGKHLQDFSATWEKGPLRSYSLTE